MKKVTQILVALVVSVGIASTGNTAFAQQAPCDNIVIYNTGPGSTNVALCINDTELEVVCNNNVYVLTENSQEAVSGEAESQGSTAGGNAVSGSATNENGTTVQIGTSCGETSAPVTPETPEVPTATPAAVPIEKPSVLPYTATSSFGEVAVIAVITIATAAITARLAVAAYRRATLK